MRGGKVSTTTKRRVTAAYRSGPLAVRNFRLLAGGQFASTIGDYCYAVALPWLVLSNHGSTILLGTLLACYGIPRTVLIPVGGILADKLGPRTLMLIADVLRCALVGVLTFLAARHTASLITLAPTAAVIGGCEGLFLPASFTIMPSLLDDSQLTAGNAFNQTAIQAGTLIGPAIGGTLVAVTGASTWAFAIDAASFALSAMSLALIPRRAAASSLAASSAQAAATGPDSPATKPDGLAAESPRKPQSVLTYVRHSRGLQLVMLVAIAMNLGSGGMAEVALPALAHAHWGAGGYGAVLASMAVGAILGTLYAARMREHNGYLAAGAFIVSGFVTILVPYLGGEAGAAAALLIMGGCQSLAGVIFFTMAQRTLPPAMLGRVLSMIMLCSYGAFPLSVALAGVVIRHVGITPFFPIAGTFLVLSIIGGNTQRAFREFGSRPLEVLSE